MRTVLLSLLVFVSSGWCERHRPYINFKLTNITAGSPETLNRILEKLQNIDVWGRDELTNSMTVIVSPEDVGTVSRVVTEEQAGFKILNNDLQKSVDEEFRLRDMRRKKRQVPTLDQFVTQFLTLDEIYKFQDTTVASCKNILTVEKKTIGYSTNGKPINVMRISKDSTAADKKTIFIEAGIHAREWLSPATANYIIYQLACKEANSDMLDLFNWEIVSTLNPDGYEYTHTGYRLWRKNRQRNVGSNCIGTDLNRNFEAGFGLPGAGSSVCSDTYRGTDAYSAPETKALRDYIMSNKDNIISYLALHTYGQYILVPFGYKQDLPSDYERMMALAREAEEAMNVPFTLGSGYRLLGATAGVSDDFAREVAGISLSYTWELMPKFSSEGGFAPDESTITKYTPVIWRGIRAYAQAVADNTPTPATTAATVVTRPSHVSEYLWNLLQSYKDASWYPAYMEQLLAG